MVEILNGRDESIDAMALKTKIIFAITCKQCPATYQHTTFGLGRSGRPTLGDAFNEGWRGVDDDGEVYALCPDHATQPNPTEPKDEKGRP